VVFYSPEIQRAFVGDVLFAGSIGRTDFPQGNHQDLIDSITHFWIELTESYMRMKKRSRLQFEDWAYLKTEWRRFTDLFVNSNLHIIVCGRAGFEYDYSTDEESGKNKRIEQRVVMLPEAKGSSACVPLSRPRPSGHTSAPSAKPRPSGSTPTATRRRKVE
jgi:hypothetical protein